MIEVLKSFRNRKFLLIEPGGNWGDYLIYHGARKLLSDLGIGFETIPIDVVVCGAFDSSSVLYLHGGGGLNSWCSGRALDNLKTALLKHTGIVIQGPQTVELSDEYLASIATVCHERRASMFFLFAREEASFRALSKFVDPGVNLAVSQDTALYLDKEDLADFCTAKRVYHLAAIRQDGEAPVECCFAFDRIGGVLLDPASYARNYSHWIRIHARSRSIVTNRTHSAILGSVLGIQTTLMPGRYHKNESIWKYSLKARGVDWFDCNTQTKLTTESCCFPTPIFEKILASLPRRVRSSYKVTRFLRFLSGVPAR